MHEIKMSVIVPTHGRVDLFKETLASLIKQTSKEFEVIVTDDSDKLEDQNAIKRLIDAAISESHDLRIKYIFTKSNLLQAKNTNQGLENATGKYLRILHSDDLIAPECIEKEIEAFETHPECYFLNHSAVKFTTTPEFYSNCEVKKFNIFNCWISGAIFTGCLLPTTLAFRKEVYNSIGGMKEDYKFLCDWEFFSRLILNEYFSGRNEAMYITGQLVGWRQHENSITSTMALTHFEEHKDFIENLAAKYKSYKILSQKDLKNAINAAVDYRYNRLLNDYKKYGNFVLPKLPIKFLKRSKYEKMTKQFYKLKKHLAIFFKPFKTILDWLIQPLSIVFYFLSFVLSVFKLLALKEEIK